MRFLILLLLPSCSTPIPIRVEYTEKGRTYGIEYSQAIGILIQSSK